MRVTLCAGVIALAALSLLSIAPPARAADVMKTRASATAAHTASIDVARIKSALHLTPEQEAHWAPVEAALRDRARRQERDANDGLVRRVSKRVVQVALNSATVHRLAAAARPLVKTFDEQQMRPRMALPRKWVSGPLLRR